MGTVSKKNKKNGSVNLTPAQLRHLARPHEGFEAQLEALLELYRQNPEELYMKGASADQIEAALDEYRTMLAAADATRKVLAAQEEQLLVSGAGLWSSTLGLYARAQVAGRTDSSMKRGIAGVAQFMRPSHKRVSAPVTTPVEPPTTTTPVAPASTSGTT